MLVSASKTLMCFFPSIISPASLRRFLDFINETFLIFSALFFIASFVVLPGRVGCPHYIAPEVLTRRQYGKACDVWGAGVMLHVLLSGRLPFNGSGRRLQEAIARGRVTVSLCEVFLNTSFMTNDISRLG